MSSPPGSPRDFEWAEQHTRRLELARAMWTAGGLDDTRGLRLTRAEMAGLARDFRQIKLEPAAEALEAAVRCLECHEAWRATDSVFSDRRVIIFDDNEVTCDLIALAIQSLGCQVMTAGTYTEWIRRLAAFDPQVLILEPAHEELRSIDSLRALLDRHVRHMVPVILFTSEQDEKKAREAARVDTVGLVSKDQGIEQLTQQLEELLLQIVW